MAERSHLSIGEVLSLLREEFPDVTISKIRFLESQGLVDPERTPSGYRKFYDPDVERLRWILRQQRENFLPLKVIRGRLSEQAVVPAGAEEHASEGTAAGGATNGGGAAPAKQAAATRRAAAAPAPTPAREPAHAAGAERPGAARPMLFASLHSEADHPVPAQRRDAPAAGPRAAHPAGAGDEEQLETYTAEELAAASGAQVALVNDLKQYGLISPHAVVGGTAYFDESSLAVARCASELARYGVEARHMRIWRNAADREADLFQQIVLPLLRQRNPQARRQATDTLADLAKAGRDLRAALVERALRDIH